MLVLALGATLVGFVLLVGALFSGLLWLAIACIVVCVIGVGFLIADLLGIGRPDSEPAREDTSDDGRADEDADEVRDRSTESDLEEGPESRQPESDNEVTGRMPRISRHGNDDPPTEEIRFDRPS
ncbi:O-antigen ligase domain-containing protein [Williamsia sp. 1135]|uniref:O-antigen ligase domain-containing protein n=1 Tax=Williamsia sp. 1135 TaxID=1889262 RepID=UPI000A108396|nr:O-antigen ligase domain-containing protein [Williamsia sp. 1135]ORM33627.1 hypothetical protein BFL43_13280 [Williamsia sp. 1135]